MRNDYTGVRFGRLVALEPTGKDRHRNILWRCVCDCGKETTVSAAGLKKTKSCGCLWKDSVIAKSTTHGMSNTKLYDVWAAIKQRCCNPNNARYVDYGGRGINLCSEWLEYEPFARWALYNGYSDGLDIDRIDNERGYSPDNCRFVSKKQNNRNKRNNRFLDYNGDVKSLSEWSEIMGIDPKTVWKRLARGWTTKKALETPVLRRREVK